MWGGAQLVPIREAVRILKVCVCRGVQGGKDADTLLVPMQLKVCVCPPFLSPKEGQGHVPSVALLQPNGCSVIRLCYEAAALCALISQSSVPCRPWRSIQSA